MTVSLNIWWIDFDSVVHVSNTISRISYNPDGGKKQRVIKVGNGEYFEVETVWTLTLVLESGFTLTLLLSSLYT